MECNGARRGELRAEGHAEDGSGPNEPPAGRPPPGGTPKRLPTPPRTTMPARRWPYLRRWEEVPGALCDRRPQRSFDWQEGAGL